MLKKSLATIALCTILGGCISEPRDPAFAGASAINPDAAAKNRISLGLTYLSNGNFSQAKANLDRALSFAPKSADAHFAMAYYYQQVDELSLADEYYEAALKIEPKNPDIINSYGAFLCEQGKYQKAKSYFLKAATSKSYVSTAETYENLAICAVDQGKTDEAIEYFELALNHQPTRGKSLFLLAQLQAQEGNFGEAKKTLWKYDRVARVTPQSLWLSYEIAQGLGDTKAALGYGELMKSMFPEHPNTALFKKQMGKFQPMAKVTNKRKLVVPETLVTEAIGPTELTSAASGQAIVEDTAQKPELERVNKKTISLSPPSDDNSVAAAANDKLQQSSKTVTENAEQSQESLKQDVDQVQENLSDPAVQKSSALLDTVLLDDKLNIEDAAKREAELEAALASDFMSTDVLSVDASANEATIDGAVAKVKSELAQADKLVEPTIDKAENSADELAIDADDVLNSDEGPSYHVVLPKENLYRISLLYNIQMKYLMQWNNLDDPAITIGMKLRVKDPKNND